MNFPQDLSKDYYWEKGLIIDFNTQEARARDLRIVGLLEEVTSYEDEFLVLDIYNQENRPKHLTSYTVRLMQIKDGVATGKPFIINYPTAYTNAARWLRTVKQYIVLIEQSEDEEIISEHKAVHR